MPGLLSGKKLSDSDRAKNDRPHHWGVVLLVLGVLALYLYGFSSAPVRLGLPPAAQLLGGLGLDDDTWREDGAIDSWLFLNPWPDNDLEGPDELLILLLTVTVAFLCGYFLPVRYKRTSFVVCTVACVFLIFGLGALAGLLAGHLCVYLTLHPRKSRVLPALAGAMGFGTFAWTWFYVPDKPVGTLAFAFAAAVLYRWVWYPLCRRPRIAPVLRSTVVQSAMITVLVGSTLHGSLAARDEWRIALGALLFFWQWARVIMYHIDYKDGLVPADLTLGEYLAVFLQPAMIGHWTWGVETGQGYTYCTNNYLIENKNALALSGLKMLGIAFVYLTIYESFGPFLDGVFDRIGLDVHGTRIRLMVCDYADGEPVTSPEILLTTLTELFRWLILWGGVVHFKVGVWRICGYRIDAYFDKPWLSTNLVTFWTRFTFHYREFLLRAFYYPIFLNYLKRYPKTRIFAATMAAAAFGNLVWGHVSEQAYYHGIAYDGFLEELATWPYFFALGFGISVAQVYLFARRPKRRHWTFDRWIVGDFLCAYVTLQYFALITIFRRGCGDLNNLDLLRLILRGVGLHLD